MKDFLMGLAVALVFLGILYLLPSCASELPCTKDETYRTDGIPEFVRHPHFRNCHEENR